MTHQLHTWIFSLEENSRMSSHIWAGRPTSSKNNDIKWGSHDVYISETRNGQHMLYANPMFHTTPEHKFLKSLGDV